MSQQARHQQWQTPATDSLTGATKTWPTPQAHDTHKGDPKRVGRFGTKAGARNLTDDVMLWATPRALSGPPESAERKKELGRESSGGGDLQFNEQAFRFSPQPPKTSMPGDGSSNSTCRLNPRFVEWLMGLPLGWTGFEPAGMASYLSKQRRHLSFLLGDSDSDWAESG